jgi:acetyl esterase/lipase
VSIILPGWQESCKTEWVIELIGNLKEFRGGCILCMDYSPFSKNSDYFALVRQFYDINDVLVDKLHALASAGFDPKNIFMFGFSFGGRLALSAGVKFGEKRIGEIDSKLYSFGDVLKAFSYMG